MAGKSRPRCRRCGKNLAVRPRRLCCTCYYAPGVREQYPIENESRWAQWGAMGAAVVNEERKKRKDE